MIAAVALVVAACAGGDIGSPVRPLTGQHADGGAVALTGDVGSGAAVQPAHLPLPIPTQPEISFTVGYANAQRLGYSALVGEPVPKTPDLDVTLFQTFEIPTGPDCATTTTGPECTDIIYSTGRLSYGGHPELPPFTDTFLAYGFVPVTATIQLIDEQSNCPAPTAADANHTVADGICLFTLQHGQYPTGQGTTGTAKLVVHLSNVKVDGTPLNVGSHCQAPSADLQVRGSSSGNTVPTPPGQYFIAEGGTLTGTVAIPAVTGCVTPSGENLDPLLTSAVSGSGNAVQLTQGGLCTVGTGCVPPVPTPDRSQGQVLLESFGGSANGGIDTGAISCTSSRHATAITGKPGTVGAIGSVGSFDLSGCTAQLDGGTCTAAGKGLPWPVDAASYDPVEDEATGTIGDSNTPFDLDFTCKGTPSVPACSVEVTSDSQTTFGAGSVNVIYDYRTGALIDFAAALAPVNSTCPGFFPSTADSDDELVFFMPSYVVNSSSASQK